MDCLKTYKYRPLDPQQQDIRLLKVFPGRHGEPIKADVKHISLSTNPLPLYETISYVWGDPGQLAWIQLSGHNFSVPHNTHVALQRMRLSDQPRTLWIDAVCINQDDVHERSRQVLLMGRIYSCSTANLIHLCEDENLAGQVSRVIRLVDQVIREATDGYKAFAATVRDSNTGDLRYSRQVWHTSLDSGAVQYLLSLPWFR